MSKLKYLKRVIKMYLDYVLRMVNGRRNLLKQRELAVAGSNINLRNNYIKNI